MSLEELCKRVRDSMGTKEERMAAHAKRSADFNKRCAEDFEKQRVTPELLAKRCTL